MNTSDSPPGDVVLLERAIQGDAESFGLLFDRHHGRVYRHTLRLVQGSAAAEDIVAMVFLEAWRKRSSITSNGETILPWLLVTANNVASNARRAERRHALFLARLPEPEHEPDPAHRVADRLENAEHQQDLNAAFNRLGQRDQDILTLCVLEEMSMSTAGSVLGIPPGTVKSRLSRAKSRLASMVPHLALYKETTAEGSLR